MATGSGKRRVLKPGDTVIDDRYKILKVIHTKGMSNVYLVEDSRLMKQWCLKEIVLSEVTKSSKREYESLIREANIMRDLNHSNIPRIVSIEDDGDSKFIIMDYVDGRSVRDWMNATGGIIDQATTIGYIRQVCKVLIYLHNRKHPIFYRDMKPSNIMVQSDGGIKLIDFGISEVITEENKYPKEPLGTKGYAPPEQRRVDLPYDLRSDIYALGQTMYCMLTGCDPGAIKKGETQRPVREWNPSVSIGLEKIISKCIEKDPDARYQSVEEVLYDIENYDTLESGHTRKIKRRIWTTFALLMSGVLTCALSIIPYAIGKSQSDSEYLYLVAAAEQSGRVDDYIKAIEKNPENLGPYPGLIEAIKTDGVFEKSEESGLLNLLNPVLSKVKTKDEYPQMAFNIGKLYWFYYEDSLDNCMTLSTKWFKDSIDGGYEPEESEILYNLGNFKKSIAKFIAEAEDSGLYKKYWEDLMKAKTHNSGEIIEIQINLAIMDAINSYTYRLKQDGVSVDEIKAEIDRIGVYLSDIRPTSGKAEELFKELQTAYDSISASTWKELGGKDNLEGNVGGEEAINTTETEMGGGD